MSLFSLKKSCYAIAIFAPVAMAADDVFNVDLAVQHVWDDNFARSPEPVSEQFTVSSAAASFNKKIQNQNFSLSGKVSDYKYDLRDDLDAVTKEGKFRWFGQWAGRIKTDLEWTQSAHVVDRLEFVDKDIVIRDDAKGMIGYGSGDRLAIYVGGRKTDQTHWNDARTDLDYDEEEGFIEAAYKTALKSTIVLRLKSGERVYPNRPIESELSDLDFDYQQIELDTNWILTSKTSVSAYVAGFIRDGAVNDSSGALADFAVMWAPTEKLLFTTGLEYKEPAVGEISESPSEVKGAFVSAYWQITGKIKLGTDARYYHRKYDRASPGLERSEDFYNYSPLTIVYEPFNNLKIRVDTTLRDNQSPLLYRDYTSKEVALGLSWRY